MEKKDLEDKQKSYSSANNPKQPNLNGTPRKRVKKLKQNPFEDLLIRESDHDEHRSSNKVDTEWIKCQPKPLSISVVDHSRINRFYSHKSIQKYIKYLYAKNIPNPMWLSIKRQSQIQHIIFLDIQVQNNIFYQHFRAIQAETEVKLDQNNQALQFLTKFNLSSTKAYFKESRFLKDSVELWDALFVYDEQAVKEEAQKSSTKQLCEKLNQQTYQIYQTYLLTEEQRRFNLYPFKQLPVYKDYYEIKEKKQIPLKNKILVVDCQMVMSYNNFQLARTSIMNFEGELIYDEFFKPDALITSYNTQFSGITQQTLKNVTKKISDLHKDLQKIMDPQTILIGHSLQNDLHAMKLQHDRIIDTSVLFSRKNGSKMKLKTLSYNILNRKIQEGTHCSEEDCQATLDLVRRKIQASQCTPIQSKNFHLLTELQQLQKKVVIVDSDVQFIRHRKEYLGIHFEAAQFNENFRQQYIPKIAKYFDKSIKNPDIIFSKIRKTGFEQWQEYYKGLDNCIEELHSKCQEQTVFFLNFQVNNLVEIYPNSSENILERRRPFCLLIVKHS